MKYSLNLFESIKEAINKKSSEDSGFHDFLKLEIGKTYIVRLVPNLSNSDRTIFNYYHHFWKSVVTNQAISVLCPNTYGESCPIDEYRSKIYATKNEVEIEKISPIKRNQSWLCNVYVIKDPTNPENEGQVKILRFGKQLFKIISEAIDGEDSNDFGMRIFDLSESGCNLRIKVDKNDRGYATYTSSRFLSPCALDGVTDVDAIHSSIKELDNIFPHKTRKDIQTLLDVHFLGKQNEGGGSDSYEHDEEEEAAQLSTKRVDVKTPTKPVVEKVEDDTPPFDLQEEKVSSAQEDALQDILKDL